MVQNAMIKQKQKHLSAFDLTSKLIRGGLSELDLSPNTKLVLLYLSTCYNEKKGVVFPKIKTIAEAIGIAEISVKRAIKELLKENCILKAKRYKNSNEYILTNRLLETKQIETAISQEDTSNGIKLILPIEHEIKQEEIKEQQLKEEAEIKQPAKVVEVAFSSISSSKKPVQKVAETVAPLEIPAIIKNNPKIKNPLAYWRSLDDTAKADYIRKEQEAAELKARREAEEREREKRSYENYLKHEAMKNAKPFHQVCTRKEALKHIQIYSKSEFLKGLARKSPIIKALCDRFNFDLDELLK